MMNYKVVLLHLLLVGLFACGNAADPTADVDTYPDLKIAGAMKNVMWKGELDGIIQLDTIKEEAGLYGLGPLSYLRGELLIKDGKTYVSKVLTDSTMSVEATAEVSAPFFVYGYVQQWKTLELPPEVKTIKELEVFIDTQTQTAKRPFAFKLSGQVASANIHIQNLPEGTKVSSPKEAHQGQTNYKLENEEVEIIGFFSTAHQGIFTHHDSYLHMHLITADEQQMGHLDAVTLVPERMKLYLPVR